MKQSFSLQLALKATKDFCLKMDLSFDEDNFLFVYFFFFFLEIDRLCPII